MNWQTSSCLIGQIAKSPPIFEIRVIKTALFKRSKLKGLKSQNVKLVGRLKVVHPFNPHYPY
jgi:hypothetical protein